MSSVTWDLVARDRASATLKRVGDETNKLHAGLGKLGGAAKVASLALGGAAVGGLAAVLKTGVSEFSDYQKGLAQLQAGLKSTHGVAGITAKQMENLATNIQNYSGQTDDSIVATEKLLLTFTNIRNQAGKNNDVFTQTTKIAADMAARMGGDASSQAIRLGKALNDPVKGLSALSRVGVSFTKAQQAQIKAMVASGHTMGAQKLILGELTKEFGGSAKAAGETLPGQLEKLKRHFEDVSQSVVATLVPALTKIASFISDTVVPAVGKIVGMLIDKAQPAFAVIANVIEQHVIPVVKAMGDYFQTVVLPVLKGLAEFIVGTVVPALAKVLKPALDGIRSVFHSVTSAVKAHREQISTLANVLKTVAGFILKTLAPVIGTTLKIAFKVVGGVIGTTIGIIGDLIGAFRGIAHAVTTVANGVKQGFNAMVNFVKSLPGRIASAAHGMWDGIKDAFRAAINWIIDGWNSLHFRIPGFGVGPVHFGGFNLGLPQIPHLAVGGIVQPRAGGTLALLGEAGRAERVTPLGPGGVSAGEQQMIALLRQQVELLAENPAAFAGALNGAAADARRTARAQQARY